jgi:hypothetical protein
MVSREKTHAAPQLPWDSWDSWELRWSISSENWLVGERGGSAPVAGSERRLGCGSGVEKSEGRRRRGSAMAGVSVEFDLEAFQNLDDSVISRPR